MRKMKHGKKQHDHQSTEEDIRDCIKQRKQTYILLIKFSIAEVRIEATELNTGRQLHIVEFEDRKVSNDLYSRGSTS